MDLHVVVVDQQDRRLGRQVVHDPRSRGFAVPTVADTSTWRTRSLRTYDPIPNPDQPNGCCTGVGECVMANTVGVRQTGHVLDMADAQAIYTLATSLDPFPGQMPEQDTGSSGLAAAKAARQLGLVQGEYRWLFRGADQVVQTVMDGRPVSVGTWWYDGLFRPRVDSPSLPPVVEPTGNRVGGHQWTIRGYHEPTDTVVGRCWWGRYRDVRMKRAHLAELLADDGDAHVSVGVAA